MAVIKKKDFIPQFLEYVERACKRHLPEEDFEMSMFDKAVKEVSKYSSLVDSTIKSP